MRNHTDVRSRGETRVFSLRPEVHPDCRVLVLGSMPGAASLSAAQYYANPRNLFWTFMGRLCGAGPELAYPQRLDRLRAAGIGLWDVLASCERKGSLDQRIDRASEVPNELPALCARLDLLRVLAFNGAKAHAAFRYHVVAGFEPAVAARLELIALPSTSPANAGQLFETKLARWRRILEHQPLTSSRKARGRTPWPSR